MSTTASEAPDYLIGSKDDPEMERFTSRAARTRAQDNATSVWHMNLYIASEGVVKLPWSHTEHYINVTVTDTIQDETTKEYTYPVNEKQTLAVLSAVAKYASKQKDVTVDKKYDGNDFELNIHVPVPGYDDNPVRIKYWAARDVVCTKKVVGTKIIPAQVYKERIEEIVEWECAPVSLLGFDASASE